MKSVILPETLVINGLHARHKCQGQPGLPDIRDRYIFPSTAQAGWVQGNSPFYDSAMDRGTLQSVQLERPVLASVTHRNRRSVCNGWIGLACISQRQPLQLLRARRSSQVTDYEPDGNGGHRREHAIPPGIVLQVSQVAME